MANELAERMEPQAVVRTEAPTPAHMLQTAIEKGMTPEMIEKFMDLEERYRKNEAKKAFDAAVAAFHENPPHVTKDKVNPQYQSRYTSLGNLVNTVSEALGNHGLHASWKIEQPDGQVRVTCVLAHTLGHSESVTMTAPPDGSGSKNPIQMIKSTVTYLRGATFEAVTGIASDESTGVNLDDDGNSGSGVVASALATTQGEVDESQVERILYDLEQSLHFNAATHTIEPATDLDSIRAIYEEMTQSEALMLRVWSEIGRWNKGKQKGPGSATKRWLKEQERAGWQ